MKNLQLGDLCVYKNKSIEAFEIVEVAGIIGENQYLVKHLEEEGSWNAYKDDLKLYSRHNNNEELMKIYRKNALNSKLYKLKTKILYPEDSEEYSKIIKDIEYEKNFIGADYSQYEYKM